MKTYLENDKNVYFENFGDFEPIAKIDENIKMLLGEKIALGYNKTIETDSQGTWLDVTSIDGTHLATYRLYKIQAI